LLSKPLPIAVRWFVICMAIFCSLATTISLLREIPRISIWFADFTVFWTASWFPNPYDVEALTRAQQWLLPPNPTHRPFVYPPTGLILIKPLSLLSYSAGIIVWTALGLAAFFAASATFGRKNIGFLLSPMFAFTIMTGQASLFIGAAIATSMTFLGTRDVIAGLLLGIIGAIKPQVAILVPMALLVGKHHTALVWAIVAGAAMILASLTLGPHLWVDWIQTLPGFAEQVLTPHFRVMNWAPGLWYAPVGIACVWYVFKSTTAPEIRLVSLVAGTCLCLPYMMNYDLVAMAPAASVLLFKRDWESWVVGFFALGLIWFSPIAVALGAPLLAYRAKLSAAGITLPEPAAPSARRGTGGAFRLRAGRGRRRV
jgi:hypothetical protein